MNREAFLLARKVGSELRVERMNAGLSIGKLSKLSGVSKGEISKVENGKANVTLGTLKLIAHAIGLTITITIEEP